MTKEEFYSALQELEISLTEYQKQQLNEFYHILLEWNEKINLTTIVEEKDVYLKHFYDSLTLVKAYDLTKEVSFCDVGSGAGFPGIVLKIVFPQLKITLIDALQKRVNYLNDVITRLQLKNIEVIHTRMEDYARIHREKFDVITARAVGNMNLLTEICVAALKVNGVFLFMKSNYEEELEQCKRSFSLFHLEVEKKTTFQLPIEDSKRSIIRVRKNLITDSKYPRSIDKIKKNPL